MSSSTAAASPRSAAGPADERRGVAVVVPCYRERTRILGVLERVGREVQRIYVVDDGCPEGTGEHVRARCPDPRVHVVRHERNRGVGGATLTGYRRALDDGARVIVKLDGDGQMDPALIPALIAPVVEGRADYAKGNRFYRLEGLTAMPFPRLAGNLALSFLTKLSSGYWNVFDPTNGFTAIHWAVARELPFERLSQGYFFESDMLFRLNLMRATVVDVPMAARYGAEESKLALWRALPEFAFKHCVNTAKRIAYSYFLRDFNVASLELLVGAALLAFGGVFGLVEWRASIESGVPATAGTVLVAALPVILGAQLLLAFLGYDVQNVPRTPLHPQLEALASAEGFASP
jgi:glycosyltransferase involved in cell wall biosynthesis